MSTRGCDTSAKLTRAACEAYGHDAARLVRENPYRLADDIHGNGFVTADSLRLMLGIASTSTFRLHAALKYVLGLVARTIGGSTRTASRSPEINVVAIY